MNDLWLAVGSGIGNWKDLTHSEQFLGVALVIAKIADWEAALKENFKGQTIEQRMKQPLQNLPEGIASNTHYTADALKYFKTYSVRGLWTLDKMVAENSQVARLKNELCSNLGWLAKHPLLVTIGTYGQVEWVKNHLHHTENDSHALGHAYALLATLIIPFLKDEGYLLIEPTPHSDFQANLKEFSQIEDPQAVLEKQSNDERNDERNVLTSSLLEHIQLSLRLWHRTKMVKQDSGSFRYLQQNYFKDTTLDGQALKNIADMGATIMGLSQNIKGDIRLHDPTKIWRNVRFFPFEELLSS